MTELINIKNPVAKELANALLSSYEGYEGNGKDYTICDFDKECVSKLYSEFQQFIDKCEIDITAKIGSDWESLEDFFLYQRSDGCVEAHFIYTRNGEGSGFWDTGTWRSDVSKILAHNAKQFGQIECYEGDDGLIYF